MINLHDLLSNFDIDVIRIREILIISTIDDLPSYKKLLGSGSELGVSFHYIEQPSPDGLAQAFVLGEDFIGNDDVCLVLGDNIFMVEVYQKLLQHSVGKLPKLDKKATVFGYYVTDPALELWSLIKIIPCQGYLRKSPNLQRVLMQ